ncbi:MAG: segregation/condensation protein A [Chloroflexi bacterium]|nr:segregation/condensation protein A [Chloroflexota bacterium]
MASATPALCTVALPLFEGPLDLLLSLIEENKLTITDISLAAVADQYVAYVKCLEAIDPAAVMEYLLIAVRLMLIKSQVLLPAPEEREGDNEEPVDNLAEQLIAYQQAKAAAEHLREIEKAHRRSFLRPARPVTRPAMPVLKPGDALELHKALKTLLARLEAEEKPALELEPQVSIDARIKDIRGYLKDGRQQTFRQLLTLSRTRDGIVATFLALLQLLKRQEIEVQQDQPLGEIWIRSL